MTPPMPDLDKLARGLTDAQRRALLWLTTEPQAWPKGSEVSLYVMADGKEGDPEKEVARCWRLCKSVGRAPPGNKNVWGRTLWVLTPLGLALKAHIERTTHD